jgi:hypothetical protein
VAKQKPQRLREEQYRPRRRAIHKGRKSNNVINTEYIESEKEKEQIDPFRIEAIVLFRLHTIHTVINP